jgi:hypothetical protein
MKHLKKIIYLFVFALVLAACTGEDGEPGSAGEQGEQGAKGDTGATGASGSGFEKLGSFQGTVAGNRTDGTAFSEAFKFEYGDNTNGFYDENGSKYIDFYRYQKPSDESSSISVEQLKFESNSLVADPQVTYLDFAFEKELSVTDLFLLRAEPYFKDTDAYVLAISDEKNKDFDFEYKYNGEINYYSASYFDGTNDVPTYLFYLNKASFTEVHYRKSNGNLLGIYDYSSGQLISSGTEFDKYNKLVFKNNAALSMLTFYDKATNTSLHTSVPFVPADQFTVTNYVHDGTTGNLSFNFVLKISKHRKRDNSSNGRNTTGNDLTITGTFNSGGKVYKNIVGRTASGG